MRRGGGANLSASRFASPIGGNNSTLEALESARSYARCSGVHASKLALRVMHDVCVWPGLACTQAALSACSEDAVVFVAHLGLGAFCSVDLVAVHVDDGGPPVLAAAKTCTLAQGDPNQRAIAKESEVLERTGGSPFIMQLYKVRRAVAACALLSTDGSAHLPSLQNHRHCTGGCMR